MELRDLRVFVAVVEERGFTRAAESLHLVQSSVSDAVRRLEKEFDLRLVERNRRSVRPTPAGEQFLRWARLIMNDVDRARKDVADFKHLSRGIVRFGMLPTLTPLILPELLAKLHARFPSLEVRVEEGLAPSLIEHLADGDLDIIVLFFPTDQREDLTFVEVGAAPLSILLPPSHWLGSRSSVALPEVAMEGWITFPPHNPGRLWLEEACHLADFSPFVAAVVETPVQQRIFVEAGYGVAMVPFGDALWWQPLVSVPFAAPLPKFRLGYAYDARHPYRPLTAAREATARVLLNLSVLGGTVNTTCNSPAGWAGVPDEEGMP